jgi:hypothetical protein
MLKAFPRVILLPRPEYGTRLCKYSSEKFILHQFFFSDKYKEIKYRLKLIELNQYLINEVRLKEDFNCFSIMENIDSEIWWYNNTIT